MSELCNVNIIGGNYIIFDDDNFCIYELAFSDKDDKYDLKTNNVINLNDNIFLVGYTESNEVIGEGIRFF
ncbi:hypothetical protein [Clostridium chromiireducens]|uniref:hypothetical protein n=1 Tax=Clostridium chromiireducens TaxID=225345 RepID=UPI001FA82358|nr:hypothetical protein [Clostridium chromiireducens]